MFIRYRKLNISLAFITQSYFSVPKDVRLNSTHYLIMKINNRRELQNIAINHSADIDYKDLQRMYKKTMFFWQLIQHYHQVILSNLGKICFFLIKMTVTDQVKIIDNKIKANQGQYGFERLAAKISAYSSGDLRKYEYLTD